MLTEIKQQEDSSLNYFENFDLWTKAHYFAFKYRKTYPNLFFYYFSINGKINQYFDIEDNKLILKTLRTFQNKCNGLWGYISSQLKNKNGNILYKYVSESEFCNSSCSIPCIQDAKPYSDELAVNI
jgi:hypothetical protein